jgi:hypothetical protein
MDLLFYIIDVLNAHNLLHLLYALLTDPTYFLGANFTCPETGLAAGWAIELDNLVDLLGIAKVDH